MTRWTVRGRTLREGRPAPYCARIEDGRIVAVGASGEAEHDFGDRLILPGFVDTHVHFRDPGHPSKEDFASGSTSAAFGGVTTVLDMPNTDPPVTTRAAYRAKLALAKTRSVVDFGLFAGLAGDGTGADLLDEAAALKVYLGSSTGTLLVEDEAVVAAAVAVAARAGRTVAFHAESEECLRRHARPPEGVSGFPAHAWMRPPACERDAVAGLARLPRPRGARLHVCHLSTAEGLAVLPAEATAEVAPHHLLLEKDALARGGAYKMNPPLRTRADRDALLAALATGRVSLASDHAPHTPEEKSRPLDGCPSGVPGVETLGPLLLALAFARPQDLPPSRVVEALTRLPAEAFSLAGKGSLAPGHDADLVIVDPRRVEPVRAERLHSRCGWTPFEGMPAVFPDEVWLRGEPVVRDGALLARPGAGRCLLMGEGASAARPSGVRP